MSVTVERRGRAACLWMWHWLPRLFWILWVIARFQVGGACYSGMSSYGMTTPLKDIFLQSGSELVINCTLHSNYTGQSDSRNITWQKDGREVAPHFVTVLDSRTAQLRIPNIDTGDCGKFTCQLKPNLTLCLNVVFVGSPPPKLNATNFNCISKEWNSLNCTWQTPPSCVKTSWKLYYAKSGGYIECPSYREIFKNRFYSCIFDVSTNPPYDQLIPKLYFNLTGTNSFASSTSSFLVDHFSIVVPSPPAQLRTLPWASTKLNATWAKDSNFVIFPAALVYWLEYRSQWDPPGHWKEMRNISTMGYSLANLTPYTNYTLRVRCRSEKASPVPKMWSRPVEKIQSTAEAVPSVRVNTTSWSFEGVNVDMDKRNITIFWQSVQPFDYYGPDFHYSIKVHDENGSVSERRASPTDFAAQFSFLQQSHSYRFAIRAANSLGMSDGEAEVLVPKVSSKPPDPDHLSVVFYSSGDYKVAWDRPAGGAPDLVSSYTVFWCKVLRGVCSTPLNWTTVDSENTTRVLSIGDANDVYRFAVSANGEKTSSGLTWSKCISYYDGVLSKLKMLELTVDGPYGVKVMWSLDCTDRMGIVTGFVVQYCLYEISAKQCKDDQQESVIVNGSQTTTYTLTDLKPFSHYRITVAAKSEHGIGELFNPKVVRTDETGPTDAPRNVVFTEVTNHSIALRWDLPAMPNGVLDRLIIQYGSHKKRIKCHEEHCVTAVLTEDVECYTNYSITIQACTLKGCSPLSEHVSVVTDVGVPGQPAAPEVRWINESHVMVEWDEPMRPNGPIGQWTLFVVAEMGDEVVNLTTPLQEPSSIVNVHCGDDGKTQYGFAVRAVVVRNGDNETFVGPYSAMETLNHCYAKHFWGMSSSQMTYLAVGIVSVVVFVIVLVFLIRHIGAKVQKIRKIKVDLPAGLMEGNLGYSGFKKNLMRPSPYSLTENPKSILICSRLQSVASDAGRPLETTLHNTSSLTSIHDDVLFSEKTDLDVFGHCHNLSSDSSGCSTCAGSVSSAATARIHLSSDSGTEVDYPSLGSLADSVFFDPALWASPRVGTAPVSNCQLRLRNSNNLQRVGEECSADVACKETDGDGTDKEVAEPPAKNGAAPDLGSHYCKAAIVLGLAVSPLPARFQGEGPPSHPGLSYSRVGLALPSRAVGRNDAPGPPNRTPQVSEAAAATKKAYVAVPDVPAPGYSKIGHTAPSDAKTAPPSPSVRANGYVTVGKMAETGPFAEGRLAADAGSSAVPDDERSSWENELEDVTDDDLHSFGIEVHAAPQRGYVCLGSAEPKPVLSYVALTAGQGLVDPGDVGRSLDSDSNKPYLRVV